MCDSSLLSPKVVVILSFGSVVRTIGVTGVTFGVATKTVLLSGGDVGEL
jgi:hypothetical protein